MTKEKLKICLLSDHHISYNPRLWKEAFIWEKLGYEVVIITMWISQKSLERDLSILKGHQIQYKCFLNMIPGVLPKGHFNFIRARKRLAVEIKKAFNIESSRLISYNPDRLVKAAKNEQAAIYSAHMECGFYAGCALIKDGHRVIFDYEDWYSHDYLVPERPVRLLEKLEKFALENGLFTVCASQSMSNALQTYYSSVKSPYVVYNGFSKSENIVTDLSKKDNPKKKLIWFSRTVGSNRGIEKIIDAIQYFSFPVELHLLGEAEQSFKKDIEIMFPFSKGHALCFHDFIPHTELTKFLSDFDLGLALEEDINDNKRLTVSNKILQYIQSGIKVLATNTKGQIEVQSYFKETIGLVGNDEDSAAWANAAMLMLNKPAVDVNNNLKIFNQVFSQEAQEEKLVTLAETYF